MRIRETDDAIIVNPEATPVRCRVCLNDRHDLCDGKRVGGPCGCGVCSKPAPWATSCLAPPKVPPPNLQRFEPAGRGPCRFCGEAAILDRITGLCCACARVYVLGRP